jgi:drug/metabolite transporter, DME family
VPLQLRSATTRACSSIPFPSTAIINRDIHSSRALRASKRFLVCVSQHAREKGPALLQSRHGRDQQLDDQHYFSLGRGASDCAVIVDQQQFDSHFCAGGIFSARIDPLVDLQGHRRAGVAVTDPIRATTPVFSAAMAIIFLGEEITVGIVMATLLIITGIILLSWRPGSMKSLHSVYLWYPLAASALAGCTQVVRKFGLGALPHPFLAAAVTATSSLVVSVATLWYVEKNRDTWKMNRQCFWYFLAAGIMISLGMVAIYYALDLGKVSVVIPISRRAPFFSLIFTAVFLRDVERVTLKIVMAATMIVGGVTLLTLWK